MTHNTGIGDLSRLTGVPVRTIRYYCDEGLLESRRSSGGHRVFDTAAAESLLLIRRLRGVGLGLNAISDVLAGRVSIGEAVGVERRAVEAELVNLTRRRASLDALSTAQDGRRGHDVLVGFWRGLFAGTTAPDVFDGFVEMTVPQPPGEASPARVVAYAELVDLARQPSFGTVMARQLWRFEPTRISDRRGLVAGVAEACDMALPLVRSGQPPSGGPAVDRFVDAHARARRVGDTPRFRWALTVNAGADTDPDVRRYWDLFSEIAGETTTVGSIQRWLHDALRSAAICAD
ncbi:MerR family transcriptional regulator [Mycolicibacterium septicum]|uniref:MerR family transcriptional regulator n=1 Tax=Mycolicibacterium septicum TaxID=98668 RepID=UPI001AF35E44|nr:MerR family transcriptional regulator [Mycolicibacterium septicum]QRY50237.1 MerR family transcriptional regulator [Mycolicibacterium septicum]